jgi:choline dehydrogenase-like flavoprotein
MDDHQHYTVVVIGTGFGGTMTALSVAHELKKRNEQEPSETKNILMLERGTWWTTPVGTVQDKEVKTYDFLANENNQPVQYWPSQNTFKGVIDIVTRCFRRGRNKDGLYDLTALGWKWPMSLLRGGDGVSILRASGVGGGSLVYSNITIRPPDLIFNDPRWPLSWSEEERDYYYNLARHAIGYGVISALRVAGDNGNDRFKNLPYVGVNPPPDPNVNAGLSNIVTRSARLDPHWKVKDDPLNPRGIKQIDPQSQANALWVDRARVFQTAVKQLTDDFGTVDLAINDLTPEGTPLGLDKPPANYPLEKPINYCERQGRCNVGCLPGARHTLNKQLMLAVFGRPDGTPPLFGNLKVKPLAEVDFIEELDGGGYEIHYDQYEHQNMREPGRKTRLTVTADKVIVAAGCMGTNEIMLRSKEKGGLPGLSDAVGLGFSTNGDYIAFMEETKERMRLTRGPVTSSFGHFNTDDSGEHSDPDKPKFHTLEDQGIPPAFASLVGVGLPVIRSLTKGRNRHLFLFWAISLWALKQARLYIRTPFVNARERQEMFRSEDEVSAKMMCVVAMGREAAVGQFRLGGFRQTPLRIKRTDNKKFHKDSIYKDIEKSLRDLEPHLRANDNKKGKFRNPFLSNVFRRFKVDSITVSHPLGGCRMAEDVEHGVVDEYGRVFDKRKGDNNYQEQRVYEGLYIADGAVVPTALGVNPSLTISTLALRIADKIVEELMPGRSSVLSGDRANRT